MPAILACLLSAALAGPVRAAEGAKVSPPPPAAEYLVLEPFVVPVIEGSRLGDRQFTLVLALEPADESARKEVIRRVARIRDALYPYLYRLVALSSRQPQLPSNRQLARKLAPIVQEAAGQGLVASLVVRKAFLGAMP